MLPKQRGATRWPVTILAFLVSSLCPLCLCGESSAALDPETDKPYRLEVVLHIADHRLLTPVFKEQVERELRDSLQAAFGDLAKVEVTRDHPRLKEVLEKGLQQTLDGWKDVSKTKTHFVLIDYVNGQYEIQARQHDGWTGQASPVVRREQTTDRQFVARTAALLVDRDFGLIGTVTDKGDGPSVRLTLKGGRLGVPLERWVKKDEIFLLVRISQAAGGQRGQPVPWALLQVEEGPRDGVCVCRLYHRHPEPLAGGPGVLGYRCLKVATTQAPLRLRLVEANARTLTPKPSVQVHVRQGGFQGETNKVQGITDADGFFQTDGPGGATFQRVAFVSVIAGKEVRAQIPIPIVDDRLIVCPVNVVSDAAADLRVRRDIWVEQVYDNLQVLAALFTELKDMVRKPDQLQPTLEKAQARLKQLQDEIAQHTERQNSLRVAGGNKLDLTEGEERLKDLQKGREELKTFIAGVEKIIREEKDPKRKELQARVQQARLAEGEADFEEAIKLYQKAIDDGLDNPEVKDHLDKLKRAWALKGGDDGEHAQARKFVYKDWPKFELEQMEARLEQAHKAFAVCRDAKDTLTPQKLLHVAIAHVGKVREELARLQPDVNEDDQKKAKALAEVSDGLKKLIEEVAAYVKETAAPR